MAHSVLPTQPSGKPTVIPNHHHQLDTGKRGARSEGWPLWCWTKETSEETPRQWLPKKRHFKNVKLFIHQEDTITVNEHAPRSTASKHTKWKMTTGRKNRQIHKYVWRCQGSLPRSYTSGQRLSKDLQSTRTSENVPPDTMQHTLFSSGENVPQDGAHSWDIKKH